MILLAKVAVGFGTTLAVAGAYTFHQGVIRVDIDEFRDGGSHVHMWVPAAAVPMALRFVPEHHLRHTSMEVREGMPVVRSMFHELKNYPNTVFVEVTSGDQHVRIATENGRLAIDVSEPQESVHLRVPVNTVEDAFQQLERATSSVSVADGKALRSDAGWL
jgi:hypothetical protein